MKYNNLIKIGFEMACFCESQTKKIFVNHKLALIWDSQKSFLFVIYYKGDTKNNFKVKCQIFNINFELFKDKRFFSQIRLWIKN